MLPPYLFSTHVTGRRTFTCITTCPAALRSPGLDTAATRLQWARRKLPASPCLFWERPGNFCKHLLNLHCVIFPLMQGTGFMHHFTHPLQWAPQQQAAKKSRVLDARECQQSGALRRHHLNQPIVQMGKPKQRNHKAAWTGSAGSS